jgi:predicted nucleotidyltransferase
MGLFNWYGGVGRRSERYSEDCRLRHGGVCRAAKAQVLKFDAMSRRAMLLSDCDMELTMFPAKLDDPVLMRLGEALRAAYGSKLERTVLFGSRARGDARADSDYDVAVFIYGMDDFWAEADRLTQIETNILCDTGAVINAQPFGAGAYDDRTGLMSELRRDGIDL